MTDLTQSLPKSGVRWGTMLSRAARTRLFEMCVLMWSLPFGLVICTYFQLRRMPREVRWALRLWSRGFLFFAAHVIGVRYTLENAESVPQQPVIYVGNHQSYWESIAFTAFVANLNVVTKAEAMRVPVFGWGLRHAPMIRIDRHRRGSNLRRLVRETKKSLRAGRSVLIFPEGTRVPPGERMAYLRGLELVYRECDCPVVPVVHNAGRLWSEGFRTKKPGTVTLRFLPAFLPGKRPTETAASLEALINTEKDKLVPTGPE